LTVPQCGFYRVVKREIF